MDAGGEIASVSAQVHPSSLSAPIPSGTYSQPRDGPLEAFSGYASDLGYASALNEETIPPQDLGPKAARRPFPVPKRLDIERTELHRGRLPAGSVESLYDIGRKSPASDVSPLRTTGRAQNTPLVELAVVVPVCEVVRFSSRWSIEPHCRVLFGTTDKTRRRALIRRNRRCERCNRAQSHH
jgi:hypothetical protein